MVLLGVISFSPAGASWNPDIGGKSLGGVRAMGELRRFNTKSRSYTILVPPGVVLNNVPPGVVLMGAT